MARSRTLGQITIASLFQFGLRRAALPLCGFIFLVYAFGFPLLLNRLESPSPAPFCPGDLMTFWRGTEPFLKAH